MTEVQLDGLGSALDEFLKPYLFCCGYTQTFAHLHTYCRGLLSDLPRKSVEPIANAAGCAVRTLQEFLRDHDWSHSRTRELLQQHVVATLAGLPDDGTGCVGLVDETATPKCGDQTPGVHHQYCGHLGKQANCVVTVHLGVCKGRYKTLIDTELFLPEVWSADRPRCRRAGIPKDMVHRPKWQVALAEIDRARRNGVALDWLTFDEEYGTAPLFASGLDERELLFVGEVPKVLSCLAHSRSGRRPAAPVKGQHAFQVVRHSPAFLDQPWQRVRLTRQSVGAQVWEVKGARIWQVRDGQWSRRSYWLIWARNVPSGAEKYFLSNAPADAKVATLVRLAFRRWNVEHGFRFAKSEVGFSHYEGRNYTGLMRHQVLCLLMTSFAAEHAQRLRGEKSGGDDGAGEPGHEPALRGVAGGTAGDDTAGVAVGDDCLPPTPQCRRPPVPPEGPRRDHPASSFSTARQESEILKTPTVALYC